MRRTKVKKRPKNVNLQIDAFLEQHAQISSGELSALLGVSRQAAHAHLRAAVQTGMLQQEGAGRSSRYTLANQRSDAAPMLAASLRHWRYRRRDLDEAAVWDEVASTLSAAAGKNVREILQYSLTEMVNNAIDHSSAAFIDVAVSRESESVAFEVRDDGEGIFAHLVNAKRAEDPASAILALGKGKLTTQPERHSGEGIFFTSKAADLFVIDSGGWQWSVDNLRQDEAIASIDPRKGTTVRFVIDKRSKRRLHALFEAFSPELVFSKTKIRIKLYERGVTFVSRSEATRLVNGLEKFSHVVLDFARVQGVGQGFADEVFRVWANAHPEIRIESINMSAAIEFMVGRVDPER